VLKVADNEKAINDLGQQLSQKLAVGGTVGDFLALGASIANQAASLNNLVDTRQATYDLLNLTRRELDAAAERQGRRLQRARPARGTGPAAGPGRGPQHLQQPQGPGPGDQERHRREVPGGAVRRRAR